MKMLSTNFKYGSGIFLCLLGMLLLGTTYWHLPSLIRWQLTFLLPITNGSQVAANFADLPVKIYWNFYIFNVTNPISEQEQHHQQSEDGENQTTTTITGFRGQWNLQEIGPFVYEERRHKEFIDWSEDEGQLRFEPSSTFHFVKEKSIDIHQNLTTINGVAISFSKILQTDFPFIILSATDEDEDEISEAAAAEAEVTVWTTTAQPPIKSESKSGDMFTLMAHTMGAPGGKVHPSKLFTTQMAEEIIIKGYRVEELDATRDKLTELTGADFLPLELLPNNTFGILYGRNGSWNYEKDGTFEIYTGAGGINELSQLGKIRTWNSYSEIHIWEGIFSACNNISGATNGEVFPPFVSKSSRLKVFSPMLSRPIEYEYESDAVYRGIRTVKFVLSEKTWRAPNNEGGEECFCRETRRGPICNEDGLFEGGPSFMNAPVYVSQPHLTNVSESIRRRFTGLDEYNANQHQSYLELEPLSGTVISASLRTQLNVLIHKGAGLDLTDEEDDLVVFPYARIDVEAKIDAETSCKIEDKLNVLLAIHFLLGALGIIPAALLIYLAYNWYSVMKRMRCQTTESICNIVMSPQY